MNRIHKYLRIIIGLLVLSGCIAAFILWNMQSVPWQTTGIKIGEVSDSQAVIWTRLTESAERANHRALYPTVLYHLPKSVNLCDAPDACQHESVPSVIFPDYYTIDTIEGAVPAGQGQVRVRYCCGRQKWQSTDWQWVNDADGIKQFVLTQLKSNAMYQIRVESRSGRFGKKGETVQGRFQTAPASYESKPVLFSVVSNENYFHQDSTHFGFLSYHHLDSLKPDFHVLAGDAVHYDNLAKTGALARWHWDRMFSLPSHIQFYNHVPAFFVPDDQDVWFQGCRPGMLSTFMGELTFKMGKQIYKNQVPCGESIYRTHRWGKHLQMWMMDGRSFRLENDVIWGDAQMAWLERSLNESKADIKILFSPTSVFRKGQHDDGHAHPDYAEEGKKVRSLLRKAGAVVVCGSASTQYVYRDPNSDVVEYGCGPLADSKDEFKIKPNPKDQYFKKSGGFIVFDILPKGENVELKAVFCSSNGKKNFVHEISR